jgi:hypothetical protein
MGSMVIGIGCSGRVGGTGAWSLAALSCLTALSAQPAAAQGFFESLFGFRQHYARPQPLPPQTSSYADPNEWSRRDSRRYTGDQSGYVGRGTTYCVRTCDGRYFPMQRLAGVSPAELCRSFCPSSTTMVFSGSKIDHAVASNGTRYADLDNAFVYRDRMVENCTCNGKDGLGLARLNTMTDPTLRTGDIVATNDGLVNYRGRTARTAEFTPVDASSGAWAKRLSEIKVRPVPGNDTVEVAPPANAKAGARVGESVRRNQAAR